MYSSFKVEPIPCTDTALDLALNIAGVDRYTHVLHIGVAQDGDFSDFRIDLYVDDIVTDNQGPAPSVFIVTLAVSAS